MDSTNANRLLIAIAVGVASNFVYLIITYSWKATDIIPVVVETKSTVDSIKAEVLLIKSNYVSKDNEGREVKVGLNTELEGNNVTVFRGNKLGLNYSNTLLISNPLDVKFKPTITLIVTEEVEMKNDEYSDAEIFISKDAVIRLGLSDEVKKGVFTLNMRIHELQNN